MEIGSCTAIKVYSLAGAMMISLFLPVCKRMYSTVFSLGSSKASTAALDFWTKSFTSAQLLKKKEGRVDMHDGNDMGYNRFEKKMEEKN